MVRFSPQYFWTGLGNFWNTGLRDGFGLLDFQARQHVPYLSCPNETLHLVTAWLHHIWDAKVPMVVACTMYSYTIDIDMEKLTIYRFTYHFPLDSHVFSRGSSPYLKSWVKSQFWMEKTRKNPTQLAEKHLAPMGLQSVSATPRPSWVKFGTPASSAALFGFDFNG